MKASLLSALSLLIPLALVAPAQAENLQHTQQLMSTRQCQDCNLSRVGLVYADLTGADLQRSNLSEANLTRANLSNANLQGADLSSAVLYNINLTGADLSGANLSGADLRNANLQDVNLQGANLNGANLMGALNLPSGSVGVVDYYNWALAEDQRGNFSGAIAYYTQALVMQPDFANALMGRSISRARMRDADGALVDAQQAQQFYIAQGNIEGQRVSTEFVEGIQQAQEAQLEASGRGNSTGNGNFVDFISGLANLAIQALPLFLGI
jgi:uncharacterized protein YjbI with pentapeptide repeats